MPRLQQNLVFTLAKDIQAFLRLDAGVGRAVPDDPAARLKKRDRRVQLLEQRLRDREQRLQDQQALIGHLQQEKQQRAIQASHRRPPTSSEASAGESHALPEPDGSASRTQLFRSLISPLKPGRMLDLGAGPGTFSLLGSGLGWEVTAVDARPRRFPKPENQKDSRTAERIRSVQWIQSDIREYPIRDGDYDLICILGLIHHLEVEDQLRLLESCSGTLTLLSARVAPEAESSEGPYEGYYFREPGESVKEREKHLQASWGNPTSFRHTEESLLRLMRDCGYSRLVSMHPPFSRDYTFYLCLPHPER